MAWSDLSNNECPVKSDFLSASFLNQILVNEPVSKDFNLYAETGIYGINKSTFPDLGNFPPSIIYGNLLVLANSRNNWITQVAFDIEYTNYVLIRSRDEYDVWNAWKTL